MARVRMRITGWGHARGRCAVLPPFFQRLGFKVCAVLPRVSGIITVLPLLLSLDLKSSA